MLAAPSKGPTRPHQQSPSTKPQVLPTVTLSGVSKKWEDRHDVAGALDLVTELRRDHLVSLLNL